MPQPPVTVAWGDAPGYGDRRPSAKSGKAQLQNSRFGLLSEPPTLILKFDAALSLPLGAYRDRTLPYLQHLGQCRPLSDSQASATWTGSLFVSLSLPGDRLVAWRDRIQCCAVNQLCGGHPDVGIENSQVHCDGLSRRRLVVNLKLGAGG